VDLRRCVADEELPLRGAQDITGHEEVHRLAGPAVLILGSEPAVLDLPDHRSVVPVLDVPAPPGLITEFVHQFVNASCGRTVAGQTWDLAATSPPGLVERPRDDVRRLEPAHAVLGDLSHEWLPAGRQAAQEVGLAAVALVEGHPVKVQT